MKVYIDYNDDTYQYWNSTTGNSSVMHQSDAQALIENGNDVDIETYSSIESAIEVANDVILGSTHSIWEYSIRSANKQTILFTAENCQ